MEMNNSNFRPEIAEKLPNMADYNTIFVGFPIWWYVAPTIINTFLEGYDLSGKTIIPFATSGGSRYGQNYESLRQAVGEQPCCRVKLNGRVQRTNSERLDGMHI